MATVWFSQRKLLSIIMSFPEEAVCHRLLPVMLTPPVMGDPAMNPIWDTILIPKSGQNASRNCHTSTTVEATSAVQPVLYALCTYLIYSASVSSHFGVWQPDCGRCCHKCTADLWNTYSHTVGPLYNRHFGTLILVLITEVSSIQRSFNTHTGTQNSVLIIEVSSIQRFVIERSHCTLIPAFIHSYMQ